MIERDALRPVVELKPRLVVFGVGGAGGNAVDNMIAASLGGVEFVAANTDSQALTRAKAKTKLQLGARITEGLGAGARPDVGARAAEDSVEDIRLCLEGAHMVFITAGMGGGTGTGAAPVVARIAREMGVLVVAVVTRPFLFEGSKRAKVADVGVAELAEQVDTLIVIPNQNLFRIADETTTIAEAFRMADEVLHAGVRGVTDLITRPGLINLDFADVRTVMNEFGSAMLGTGEGTGERRAVAAAHAAMSNPLLEDATLRGARAVLINITGGRDMTLFEVDEAANEVRAEVDPDAQIIVGSAFDDTLDNAIRVSILATGIGAEPSFAPSRSPRAAADAPSSLAVEAPPAVLKLPEDRVVPVAERPLAEPERGGAAFTLFGRRRRIETERHERPLQPALSEIVARPAAATPTASEDLTPLDETDLEIPAFLRRQSTR